MRVLFLFLAGIAHASPIRIDVIQGHAVASRVFINGEGPFRFLLDTGAQTNQVDINIARRLHLSASSRVSIVTPVTAAEPTTPAGRVAHVSLGTAEARDQEFLFTHLTAVRRLDPAIQGVLGQEFLAHFDYLLDFGHGRLAFRSEAPESAARIPFLIMDGCMSIPTSEGAMILDSGTDAVVLFSAAPGSAQFQLSSIPLLTVGSRGYRQVKAAFAPASGRRSLLPACLLRSVFVSNSGRFIVPMPSNMPTR